ncbi:MAG TPA: triple tyrosine motif-containing protein, partial [Chitinophagaceae bacterium]|nr:triple tyrosine motif-containing protein [Chitinophagaceae bacterium]
NFKIFNKEISIAKNDTDDSPLKKDITESNSITIPYRSSVFEFEFAALNYSDDKKQYSYMLEGFDKTWNEASDKRTATYTNLDPGDYLFKVKSMNNDGQWSSHILTFQLTVTPPFWLTWWFRALCILFILGCFVGFYRFRMKAIIKQKAHLEKQVKERTEEIMLQKEKLSRNVEELAALKEDLQKEKYYLDSLMDHMPDAIYFKDKESRFLRVSTYMVKKHLASHPGATINDLLGKTDFDLQDEKHAKEAYEDEQEIQRTRIPKIDYIEKEIAEDGSERWVATTKLPMLNTQEEVVGTFGISRDVTKIKLLEKQQNEAMLDKAVAQGKFEIASEVMHDIGNAISGFGSHLTRIKRMQENGNVKNLTSLITFFEEQKIIMANAIGESKSDAVIKMLGGIAQTQHDNEHETIKSVTEQLNIVSNIEEILNIQRKYISGYESKDRKTVNLKNVIDDSLSMLSGFINKSNIDVSLNIANDLPPIKGDRTKLMQLLLNLIKNSMEATEENKHEKNICINAFIDINKLVLQVRDNGKGFDGEVAGQLFNRGFTTKASGKGYSLYNCKTIVESHEGTIDISSEGPDKGTITTIGFKILAA